MGTRAAAFVLFVFYFCRLMADDGVEWSGVEWSGFSFHEHRGQRLRLVKVKPKQKIHFDFHLFLFSPFFPCFIILLKAQS